MQNHSSPEILKSPLRQYMQSEGPFSSRYQEQIRVHLIKYLKFWGVDYPYLDAHKNCIEGCLPIPENSEAQRYLRNLEKHQIIR